MNDKKQLSGKTNHPSKDENVESAHTDSGWLVEWSSIDFDGGRSQGLILLR